MNSKIQIALTVVLVAASAGFVGLRLQDEAPAATDAGSSVSGDDVSFVIEGVCDQASVKYEKRFRLRWNPVPVRPNVGATQKDVQEAMWIIFVARVEVVVHTPPLGLPGLAQNARDEFLGDELDCGFALHALL